MLPCEANRPVAGFDLVAADRCQGHGIATLRCSRPRSFATGPRPQRPSGVDELGIRRLRSTCLQWGYEPDRLSSRPFAEQTQAGIGGEASRQLRDAEKQAVDVLNGHREVLDQLVRLLQPRKRLTDRRSTRWPVVPNPKREPGDRRP
jgi:hypothetical protein